VDSQVEHRRERAMRRSCTAAASVRPAAPVMAAALSDTVIVVRHFLCRALSIGRTAKATLCRVLRKRRTTQINAR
jgi:hypothetical protein